MITGGLGGLGLVTAETCVELGARVNVYVDWFRLICLLSGEKIQLVGVCRAVN